MLQSADQLFTLVPIDSPLEIESMVDGRDAGFVHLGDPVTIKFQTFPYFAYGISRGTVKLLSADSFHQPMDNSVTRGMGTGQRRPAASPCRARKWPPAISSTGAHFDRPDAAARPAGGFHLVPGMPVQADIKVGKRTAVEYLLSRVIPATTEGMHEP